MLRREQARIGRLVRTLRVLARFRIRSDLDQCPALPLTLSRRLACLPRSATARKRRILLLGDDDLLSLALLVSGVRSRITVLDADAAVLALIEGYAGSSVEVILHDVRDGLPPRLRARFDEVFTDPPYTIAGQLLFAQRALMALANKPGTGLYLCASRLYLDSNDIDRVLRFLRHGGMELARAWPCLNRYRATPEVERDLRLRGLEVTTAFDSDLFHYVRRTIRPAPSLPRNTLGRIYAYTDIQ